MAGEVPPELAMGRFPALVHLFVGFVDAHTRFEQVILQEVVGLEPEQVRLGQLAAFAEKSWKQRDLARGGGGQLGRRQHRSRLQVLDGDGSPGVAYVDDLRHEGGRHEQKDGNEFSDQGECSHGAGMLTPWLIPTAGHI